MALVSTLHMPESDFEYPGERVWEVLDYRRSRFHALNRQGGLVTVKLLGGDEITMARTALTIVTQRDCDLEFGPEHEHDDEECAWVLDGMSPDLPDDHGPGWYDYDAGLRWSDFVEGPIGD